MEDVGGSSGLWSLDCIGEKYHSKKNIGRLIL